MPRIYVHVIAAPIFAALCFCAVHWGHCSLILVAIATGVGCPPGGSDRWREQTSQRPRSTAPCGFLDVFVRFVSWRCWNLWCQKTSKEHRFWFMITRQPCTVLQGRSLSQSFMESPLARLQSVENQPLGKCQLTSMRRVSDAENGSLSQIHNQSQHFCKWKIDWSLECWMISILIKQLRSAHPWQLQIQQLLAVATKMSSRGSV